MELWNTSRLQLFASMECLLPTPFSFSSSFSSPSWFSPFLVLKNSSKLGFNRKLCSFNRNGSRSTSMSHEMESSVFSYKKLIHFALEETNTHTHLVPSSLQVYIFWTFIILHYLSLCLCWACVCVCVFYFFSCVWFETFFFWFCKFLKKGNAETSKDSKGFYQTNYCVDEVLSSAGFVLPFVSFD